MTFAQKDLHFSVSAVQGIEEVPVEINLPELDLPWWARGLIKLGLAGVRILLERYGARIHTAVDSAITQVCDRLGYAAAPIHEAVHRIFEAIQDEIRAL